MKKIILSLTKKIPFEIKGDGIKGEIIATHPKASDFVSFWSEYNNFEGSEAEKNGKRAELVISKFKQFITEIKTSEELEFETEEGQTLTNNVEIFEKYYSVLLYQKGMDFFNPDFRGGDKSPLEVISADS